MQWTWVIVVLVVIAILLAIAVFASRNRRRSRGFEVRQLPREQLSAYEGRIGELEAMFVSQPREAVAAARLMIDDMLIRSGYPVRLNDEERIRDLHSVDQGLGERYRLGIGLKNDATTEQLRRAMNAYLEMARGMIGHGSEGAREETAGRPQVAG